MKTEVKRLEDCKVQLTVEVDEELWLTSQKKAKEKLVKNLNIKGFRKGHVPAAMAEKYIRQDDILSEALRIVLNPAYAQALQQENLSPFDQASVNVIKAEPKELTLEFSFTHGPHVELGKVDGHNLEKEVASIDEKEINDDINRRLEEAADLVSVEREAKLGDTVIIDFVGYVDGKEFDGGSAENYELLLGSNNFVPGFETGVVGMKPEEQKDIEITFPEQYVAELAGKPATFKVTLHEVKEKVVNPLTDETVLDLNIRDVKTVDELKEFVKKDLLQKKVNSIEQDYLNRVIDEIVAESTITYPSKILEDETDAAVKRTKDQIEQSGLTFQQYLDITAMSEEAFVDAQRTQAKNELEHYFVLDAIALANRLEATDDEVKSQVDQIKSRYGVSEDQVKAAYGGSFDRIAREIKQNKLTRFLLEKNPAKSEPKKEEKVEEAKEEKPAKKPAAKKAKAEDKVEGEAEKKPAAKKASTKKKAEDKPAEDKGE